MVCYGFVFLALYPSNILFRIIYHLKKCHILRLLMVINTMRNPMMNIFFRIHKTVVKLQNLSWYKTGFVSRQVLHLLSKLQNWICPKTGQYKTCTVSNTKFEASMLAIIPKTWQSHLTSQTVEIFIQNEKAGLVSMQNRFWCGRFRAGTKPVFVLQVYDRHKASFGAAGSGTAQSRFWCGRFSIGAKPALCLHLACLYKNRFSPMLNLQHQNWLCVVTKTAATKPALCHP